MGRPKGSKNKKTLNKNKKHTYIGFRLDEPEGYKQPKNHKFIGYCPECDLFLTTKDLISKMVFKCPCGLRKHKKYIKSESDRVKQLEKVSSKKEYLKSGLFVEKGNESEIIPEIVPEI